MAIDSASLGEQLRFAIQNRRLLSIRYQGKARLAEPHDYGVQKGLERLLVSLLSKTPRPPGQSRTRWRLLEVARIENCAVLEKRFSGSRPRAHQKHYVWDI